MTQLVLIRHGETDWNVEGRYQGQADPPLNARGMAQAERLAEELEQTGLEVLYTSPLLRARQTAEIVCEDLGIPLQVEPRLMEIHQGDWQTRLRREIEELYPEVFRRWEMEPWQVTPPKGEHLMQVQKRVNAAVDEIVTRHTSQTIGIVAHRIPIALIKVRYQGMDPDIVRTLELPNGYWEEVVVKEK
ncbi:MAG: histidine phosphatase family protein [Anaerolineales bacterium]